MRGQLEDAIVRTPRAFARRARLVAVLATLFALGYAMAMAGLAVVIGGRAAVGIPLLIIGLVDHYPVTLQQGQLLFTLVLALSMLK